MKELVSTLKGLSFILLLILVLFLLLFGGNTLNDHLQANSWFGDIHKDTGVMGTYDEFWIWDSKHYLFFWSEFILVIFYVISCVCAVVVLSNEKKIFNN